MKPSDEAIAMAAAYWRRTLAGPFLFDNGDRSEVGVFAGGMAERIREVIRPLITEAVTVAFEAGIVKRLRALRDDDAAPVAFTVGTDYHPDPILVDALIEAGVPERDAHSSAILPWKTTLFIRTRYDERRGFIEGGDRVFVYEGRGGGEKYLMGEPDVRP